MHNSSKLSLFAARPSTNWSSSWVQWGEMGGGGKEPGIAEDSGDGK